MTPAAPRRFVNGASSVALLLAIACGGSEPATGITPGATLAVSPSTLTLTESEPSTTLYLTTTPSGGRLDWQVTAKPPWVTMESERGTISGITPVKVTAAVPATAEPGTVQGRIELIASGGTVSLPITLTIAANPKLSVSPTSLSVASTADTGLLTISNTGRGYVSWSLSGLPAWLAAIPTSGFIQTGKSIVVSLVPNRQPLTAGASVASLIVKNENDGTMIPVTVSVDVAPAPRATVTAGRVVLSPSVSTATTRLVNPGKGALTWSVTNRDAWLTVAPTGGTVAAGDSVLLSVTAPGASAGSSGGFTIASNAVDEPSLRVAAVVLGTAPALGLRVLDHRVVDAEFNPSAGLLVTVSANPSKLNVFDMETGDSWSVALAKAPCCVAIRRDGRFAVVAHDAMVSYIDLSTRQVVKTYATTSDAFDVLLPDNGWTYVFPRTDQWQAIHGINLQTGAEQNGGSIFAGTHAQLHPSQSVAYGIWFLSPADLEKYDLSKGPPARIGDSPYHGDYPMGYSLWIARDGARIFTAAGAVFRSSATPSEDMRYAGTMAGIGYARMVADNPSKNRIYAFVTAANAYSWNLSDSERSAEIRVFESSTLSALGQVALPKIPSGSTQADADGYYVFPSADGQRVYMLLKAVPSAGLLNDWALYTVDASTLP